MKIFKNDVGRPSNEIKMLRRTFCVSLVAIVISLVSIIVSIVTNKNFLTNDIKANAASSPYEVSFYPDEELFGFPWGTRWEVDGQKAYNASYEFSNKSGEDLYYKYVVRIIHDNSDRIATTSNCYKVENGKSDTKEFGEYFLSEKIEYNIKVYEKQEDCEANYPEFGNGAKVSYVAAEDDNGGFGFGLKSTQSSSGGGSFFGKIWTVIKSFLNYIANLFPSSGETKPNYSNVEVRSGYYAVIDQSGNYRSGNVVQPTSGECRYDCNCYASYFADRIKFGEQKHSYCGCGDYLYASEHCNRYDVYKALNDIRDQILKGNPVVVNVTSSTQHWITVIGVKKSSVDDGKKDMQYTDFLVVDPLRSGEINWDKLIASTKDKDGNMVRKLRPKDSVGCYRLRY